MFQRTFVAWFLTISLAATSFGKQTRVLFESESDVRYAGGASGLTGSPHFFTPTMDIRTPAPYQTFAALSISGKALVPSDAGTTFVVDAQNRSQFAELARRLTDGQENWVLIPQNLHLRFSSECNIFHNDTSCSAGVDLAGNVIERITYTIKDWYHVSPGRDPNHDGFWTDTYSGFRFTIEGYTIPEPSYGAITLALAAMIVRVPRRKVPAGVGIR
jgi:hypothetical protein